MMCTCKRSETGIGFDTSACLIHGSGGLRDLQQERIEEWNRKHPIRAWLARMEMKIRYW